MSLRRNWPLYLGVFLVSGSTTLLEISLTRVFSVSLWYQFGFMIISTALLGFGASGTYIAVKKGALTGDLRKKLATSATLYSLSILVAFALMTRIPLDPLKPVTPGVANPGAATVELIGWMVLYYAIIVVPFFFAGLTIGTALSAWAKEIGSLYFADLLGAGLGALVVVFALYRLTGQGSVVLASIGAALGALVFSLTPLRAPASAGAAAEPAAGPDQTGPARGRARRGPWASTCWCFSCSSCPTPRASSTCTFRPRSRSASLMTRRITLTSIWNTPGGRPSAAST